MHCTLRFLSLCLLLTASNCLNYHHNYNYSRVHELALIADPLPLPPRPVSYAHHAALIPTLIEYSQLRKYQLRDTNYRPEEQSLSHEDHFLLFNMEPPEGVFQDELIHIENYRLLEMRKFQVTINNPSTRLKIVITQVSTDRAEVRRDDERGGLPVSLHPGASHEFNFIFLVECMNPQFLQGCIYFFIEIYDGSILAEEKVYARKVSAAITPNHLRLGNQYYNNCPHYHVIVVKNY